LKKTAVFLVSLVMAMSFLVGGCGTAATPTPPPPTATPTIAATIAPTTAPTLAPTTAPAATTAATQAPTAAPTAAATKVVPTMAATPAGTGNIIVSAAVSLSDALAEIKTAFEAENPGATISYNLGASGDLQLQIDQGAPVDVFLSAGKKQMDEIDGRGLVLAGTRTNIAGNALVLIVPTNSTLGITSVNDITKAEVKKVAIGNTATVPAGQYAQQSLKKLGLWDSIQSKLIPGDNVRAVLTYVQTGNVDAGFVYSTDAMTSKDVTVVATVPDDSHDPIIYPGAVINTTKQPDLAKAFLSYVAGPKGQAILAKYGFTPPPS
jgi:molybdate transport system substrate-binding protein